MALGHAQTPWALCSLWRPRGITRSRGAPRLCTPPYSKVPAAGGRTSAVRAPQVGAVSRLLAQRAAAPAAVMAAGGAAAAGRHGRPGQAGRRAVAPGRGR
jgi:hypothetical protein